MREKEPVPAKPVFTSPMRDHRRQMAWQVWLPLGVVILIVLLLAVLSVMGAAQGSPQVDRWGALAAIYVIIPVLVFGVVPLVIVGGLAYGVMLLRRKTPGWMLQAQLFVIRIGLMVRRAADAATKPVMATSSFTTRAATLWDRLFHRKTAVR